MARLSLSERTTSNGRCYFAHRLHQRQMQLTDMFTDIVLVANATVVVELRNWLPGRSLALIESTFDNYSTCASTLDDDL